MQPEIKLVRNHVEIHMPNGDFYRITCGENAITVNLQSDEGTMLIKPNVSNEVKITSINVNVKENWGKHIMIKKEQVVMLPINKNGWNEGNVLKDSEGNLKIATYNRNTNIEDWMAQHLYLISDDKIKKGDIELNEWYIHQTYGSKFLLQATVQDIENWKNGHIYGNKVIASTDSSLRLPGISQSFLKQFVAVQGKGDVMMEMEAKYDVETFKFSKYDSIYDENGCVVLSIKPTNETLGIQINQDVTIVPNRMYDNKTAQTIEEAAKNYAKDWWDSEPTPETDKYLTKEFNQIKEKWAKYDFVCGFEQGVEWQKQQVSTVEMEEAAEKYSLEHEKRLINGWKKSESSEAARINFKDGFKDGWKANPKQFTEEDMINFSEYLTGKQVDGRYGLTRKEWLEKYLKSKKL